MLTLDTYEVLDALIDSPIIAVDTETTGLDPYTAKLLTIQISTPDRIYTVDARADLGPIKTLLENSQSIKILQNAKFDYKMLRMAGITIVNIFDTYLAERLLTAGTGLRCDLKSIAKRYLDETLDKAVRSTFHVGMNVANVKFTPEQIAYAEKDVEVLHRIYSIQRQKLLELDLTEIAGIEFNCIPVVGEIELSGISIDTVQWRELIAAKEVERVRLEREIDELLSVGKTTPSQTSMFEEYTPVKVNLNSPTQLMREFKRLGIPLTSTGIDELNKFKHIPVIAKLIEYRGVQKTISAFGENILSLINPVTQRIHPEFIQYGADTGRFSCSKPNVQQIPRASAFRHCFVAARGKKLVVCDYGQFELRILGELSQDPEFLHAFKSGIDLHTYTAAKTFGVSVEAVTKDLRQIAKPINFGLAYGMGPQGVMALTGKSLSDCKTILDSYFAAFKGIKLWLDDAGKFSQDNFYSLTPLRRRRYYTRTTDKKNLAEIGRQGKNAPIQGCNADVIKLALVYVHNAIQGFNSKTTRAQIVNCVHDEIVVECDEDISEHVKEVLHREMIRAAEYVLKTVPVVADAVISDHWTH
jgi:DNA polymerase-1